MKYVGIVPFILETITKVKWQKVIFWVQKGSLCLFAYFAEFPPPSLHFFLQQSKNKIEFSKI